jgi:hypothetical protein
MFSFRNQLARFCVLERPPAAIFRPPRNYYHVKSMILFRISYRHELFIPEENNVDIHIGAPVVRTTPFLLFSFHSPSNHRHFYNPE